MSPEEMSEAIDLLCLMGLATLTMVSITFGIVVRILWISATTDEK